MASPAGQIGFGEPFTSVRHDLRAFGPSVKVRAFGPSKMVLKNHLIFFVPLRPRSLHGVVGEAEKARARALVAPSPTHAEALCGGSELWSLFAPQKAPKGAFCGAPYGSTAECDRRTCEGP